jgi:DmsE family decaheme c-type cytochrome
MRAMKAVYFMNKVRPVTRILFGAVPGVSLGLRAFLILVLGAGIFSAAAFGAAAPKAKAAETKPAVSGDFVGAETCATCHEEVGKKFADNPHTKMAQMHGGNGVTCENCHGAGKAHVDGGGDTSKIFNPAKHSAKEVDQKCLSCHQGKHANFEKSEHGQANVSCISCHSVHAGKGPEHLLKVAQPRLCFQCHTDVKPQFSMPFHHKVEEGLVQCSDCHDPHGTYGRKSLKSTADQNAVCVKCHSETAGPFVYEHAPVKTEGCVACHSPHGSPNARLLNRANVNTLCLQCHSPSTNFTAFTPGGPAHNQAAQYQACIICHTDIHGSNVHPHFFGSN